MFQVVKKLLAAEWALQRHNRLNRRGVVDQDAQQFHLVREVLPSDVFQQAIEEIDRIKTNSVRTQTEWRRGSAIGGHELQSICRGAWLGYLETEPFLEKVRQATGLESLQYVPEEDTNRLSLLLYECIGDDGTGEGDGIDWHVDGSIYLGQRWAGILVLRENTTEAEAKLELEPNGVFTPLPKADMINTLVLFRGDHVRHRVRPMLEGEERVALSLLFSDWPQRTRNPMLRRYQSRVNKAFYNNPAP